MEGPHERALRRLPPLAIPVCAAALGLAWLFGHEVLHAPLLATFQGQAPLAPLYAFASPLVRPEAVVFLVTAAVFVARAPRLADPALTRQRAFVVELAALALLLPLALYLVREDLTGLGRQFLVYRNEEFYEDALRIDSLAVFLDRYVERMPTLSLHGQHFPPGNAVALHLVQQAFGPSTLAAGLFVLACFVAAILVVARTIERIAGGERARQAVLLCLASPSLLDFACTSMDGVFLLVAALAWNLAVRTFSAVAHITHPAVRSAHPRDAIACGLALFVATFFSFSALPLGAWVFFYALASGRGDLRATARRLAIVAASYVAAALLCDFATGFAIWDCLVQARASGMALMARASAGSPHDHHAAISYGNLVAFLAGSGLALVTASVLSIRSRASLRAPIAVATLAWLAVVSLGGIYFLETERIWLFALPWLAALGVAPGAWSPVSLRMLLVAGCAQAWMMELTLYTLW